MVAQRLGYAGPDLVVTDRHARGLVRKFLLEERERAAEVHRRRMRLRMGFTDTLRAAHRTLEQLDKAWSPLSIASLADTSPDGAARLGLAYLDTDRAHLRDQPGVVARTALQVHIVRPNDGTFRCEPTGYAGFTQHSLERVVQRGVQWNRAAREIGVAVIVANARLHELAVSRGFRRTVVPGYAGVFVGDFSPDQPLLRFDSFLPICAAGRHHGDLLFDLAGLLWTGNRYRDLMPALFYPTEPCPLMDEVLRVYERHEALMRCAHEPGEDWFGQAVGQRTLGWALDDAAQAT